MAIDYQRAYHQGVRVPDINKAIKELSESLGIEFCPVQDREQGCWLPDIGAITLPLKFTYSKQGPQHVELLEGPAGSIWDGREQPGLHHMGLWSDDVKAETEYLVSQGWTLRMAQLPPERGYGGYTYVQPPSGLIIELVSSAIKPRFESWWAGGSLG
jgi:catechol 2,3-dioxygenase-like lactoylglutathione lyase family enzyme